MPTDDPMFQEALNAIDQGQKARARDLLTRLIKSFPNDADAWLYMSAVVDTSKERIYCLNQAIQLDPANIAARRGLIFYGVLPPDPALVMPRQVQYRNWESQTRQLPGTEKPRFSWKWAVVYGGGALLLISAIIFLIITANNKPAVQDYHPVSYALSATYPSTATLAQALYSPTPTFIGPTPLWMLLSATYTPTPLYVNTPHPISESYRIAMRAYSQGNYPTMVPYMQQVLTEQNKNPSPDIYYYLGEGYRLSEQYSEAMKAYQKALDLNSRFAPAYLGMGRAILADNPANLTNQDQATKAFLKALDLDPNLMDASFELASMAIQENDGSAALQYLKTSEEAGKNSALFYVLRGQAYLLEEKEVEALADAQTAYNLDITIVDLYRLMGGALLSNRNSHDAIPFLERYLSFEPEDASALYWISQASFDQKNYIQAERYVIQSIQADPNVLKVYLLRGKIEMALNKYTDAVDTYDLVIRVSPQTMEGYTGIGQAYLLLGDRNSLYAGWRRLSDGIAFSQSDSDKAGILYWRAQLLEKMDEQNAAVNDWKELLSLAQNAVPDDIRQFAAQHLASLVTATPTAPSPTFSNTPTVKVSATTTPTPTPRISRTLTRTP